MPLIAEFSPSGLYQLITSLSRLGLNPGTEWLLAFLDEVDANHRGLGYEKLEACIAAVEALEPYLVSESDVWGGSTLHVE